MLFPLFNILLRFVFVLFYEFDFLRTIVVFVFVCVCKFELLDQLNSHVDLCFFTCVSVCICTHIALILKFSLETSGQNSRKPFFLVSDQGDLDLNDTVNQFIK